ncbi:hypothetical protein Y049_1942 [Burkholderia pseudomallei MSHR684]|nr:hypothetical protein DR60_3822 [Burkholderia pseudomallei]KGW51627.1 hypothetical protein Y049_1942 [Burkholderia pseudomallei MSHR684]
MNIRITSQNSTSPRYELIGRIPAVSDSLLSILLAFSVLSARLRSSEAISHATSVSAAPPSRFGR